MIKNNKGFMLLEAIITSTIVLTTLIALYTSFNNLYNNYKTKNTYYNIDAVYATKEIINSTIKNNNLNTFINNNLTEKSYGYFIKDNICRLAIEKITSCQDLQKLYNINNVIFLEYNIASFNKLKTTETNLSQTFYDYIDYLTTYYDFENSNGEYNYIVLTEIKDGEKYYYANLRMR